MPEPGFAVEFNVDPQGSELAAAALSTDSVLFVEDSSAYDAPGTVTVNDVTYDLVATDVDAGTITLGAALGAAADIGDRVFISAGGEIAYDYTLEIHTADGEPLEISVDFSDRSFWGEPGPIDPPIPVTLSDDLSKILDVPGRAPTFRPSSFQLPMFSGALLSNFTVPSGSTYTTITGWWPFDQRGGMFVDPSTGDVYVPIDGYYAISDTSVMWAVNATGRRAIQPRFNRYLGDFGGGEVIQDASVGSIRTSSRVATPPKALFAGEKIRITVSQTSGGNLDILGDSDGIQSFFVVTYLGPL